jgi:hypothetical protein
MAMGFTGEWLNNNQPIDFSRNAYPNRPNAPKIDPNAGVSMQDALLGINSFMPVTGDVQAGVEAVNSFRDGDYFNAALNGVGLLPFVPALGGMTKMAKPLAKSSKKLTKFEKAHLTAQKNAAKPISEGGLGLPPNNTAMDRAKALGFDEKTYYHGTNADIKAFDPEMSAQGGITWIADSPKYANDYTLNSSQGAGNIIPLKANMGKTAGWKEYDQLGIGELAGRGYNSTFLKEAGDESVGFVMNPNQLRSVNAAFDPARAHEADILGSADPRLLGVLGGGGLLGLGAYKNWWEKDK